MNEIIYTDGFIDDMVQVRTDKIRDGIFDAIDLLPSVPILGSPDLPDSIMRVYGTDVRRMVVRPFLVVYELVNDGDFLILGLMHERAAF